MTLKTMDPEVVWALIEEATDTLTPEIERELQEFENASCPVCYDRGVDRIMERPRVVETPTGITVALPFTGSSPLPRSFGRCRNCGTEFDIKTGLIRQARGGVIHEPH
jgi:hypothetical protein